MDWDISSTQKEWKSNPKSQDQNIKSIEIIRQCYHIAWHVERMYRVNTQECQRLVIEKLCFCQSIQCILAKNKDLSNKRRPVDWLANYELELL